MIVVADAARIGRAEGDGRGRSGRAHRVIGSPHRREARHRHVAGDALVPLAPRHVAAVLGRLLDLGGVAGHAHLVRRLALKTQPAAGRVAVVAVELARLAARAHQPRSIRVVFAEVAAVGIEIGVFQRNQIEMIEELVARTKGERERDHFRVAGGAQVVHLCGGEVLGANNLDVFRCAARRGGLHRADVLLGRAVTRLATDARLGPRRVVGVGGQVVVCRQLGDVAIEAGGVEGEHAVGPIEGLVAAIGKMPHAAGRHVVPGLLIHVVGQRQHLQATAIQRRKKVIDVLAAHDLRDRVFAFAVGAELPDAARRLADLHAILASPYRDVAFLRSQAGFGERRGIRLHGQAVVRGGPEFVEIGMAFLAALRAGQRRRSRVDRLRRVRRRLRMRPPSAASDEKHGTNKRRQAEPKSVLHDTIFQRRTLRRKTRSA